MKKDQWKQEEISEDYCFVCKDGGLIRVCDFKKCLKAYHPSCVGKDDLFLEDDGRWTCGLHSCSCGKSSSFQCFCCPTSSCRSCVTSAEFVQVRKNKGFCINCLRLAKMVEENKHVDSEGEEVDFSNTETYEFLFKDYWEIVKDQEGLSILDVQAADALLKRGENFQNESDSDKPINEESMSEPDDLEDDCDDEKSIFKGLRGKRGRKKIRIKKPRKERTFIGWASEELIAFLTSIGKNTKEPLSQLDVTEIVKGYVESKNLFQPNKKRKNHVVSDDKLRSLFRKKKLKFHRIYDLIKKHLAEEQSDQSDEFSVSSEEDEGAIFAKRRRIINSDDKTRRPETNHCRKRLLEPAKSCYAAIVADNVKLAYLKKSLVLELLKKPETFEDKVVGCFVRIKNDPKDFYYLVQKTFQLGQVIGVKKTEHPYKIGEISTDIVLCITNFSKGIKISMISDDDFEEEECHDLQQLAKKGIFKQPTIAELEGKIRSIHEDIVNHWISRELVKLQKQIDRANEKGWRRELHEYIDRRELLRTSEERMRLLEEIPEVIPQTCDTEANVDRSTNLHGLSTDEHDATDRKNASVESDEPKGYGAAPAEIRRTGLETMGKLTDVDPLKQIGESTHQESELKSRSSANEVLEIKDEVDPGNKRNSEIEVIELDDEDDDIGINPAHEVNGPVTLDANLESTEAIWHYRDPSGKEQGPFTLSCFSGWRDSGYFDDDFKVWKSGQKEEDAVLLTAALRSAVAGSQ